MKFVLIIAAVLGIIIISIALSPFSSLNYPRVSNIYEYGNHASKTENNNKDYNMTPVLKNNSIEYKFSINNVAVSGPFNNAHTNEFRESTIALVKPTFTDAAYDNKFYNFYTKYSNVTSKVNVTKNLNLLSSKVTNYQSGTVNNVFAMLELVEVMKWIDSKTKIDIISDSEVDKGKIFDSNNNSNLLNVLILGHQEYVTQSEYDNLKKFVSNGGTMIILDGNVFYAEVRYFDNNNTISLVKGQGWAYNGKSAWKSIDERWKGETRDWVGSNYFCYKCVKKFKDNPFKYTPHEEQYVSNPKDIVLLNYNPIELQNTSDKNTTIATYELKYGKGTIISMGIYSDDIIHNGKFDRFFDNLIVKYALHGDTR